MKQLDSIYIFQKRGLALPVVPLESHVYVLIIILPGLNVSPSTTFRSFILKLWTGGGVLLLS